MHLLRSRYFIFQQYLNYWLRSIDKYSLQAPFVYNFYNEVVSDDRWYYAFDEIEIIRGGLLKDYQAIPIHDLGSGSVFNIEHQRKISSIALHSLSSAKFSRFLFRVILFTKPNNILELGTSLGINTLYLSKAREGTMVYTLEGCPETAAIAKENFNLAGVNNISLIQGDIENTLLTTLKKMNKCEMVYFDANHTFEATLHYFQLCEQYASENSIFIFDDIHHSAEMAKAWKVIKDAPVSRLTLDIFDAGIVFFDNKLQKADYILDF